jgi:hypothetical protein
VLVPGQEVPFTNTFEEGIPQGAHWITTRIEKPDGALIAEKTELLEDPQQSDSTLPASIPGFGMGCALVAMVIGLLGSRGIFSDP